MSHSPRRARFVVGSLALLAIAAPALAGNTGLTTQAPATSVVTSVDAVDVTVLDAAGFFSTSTAEGVFAELYREGWRTYANTAALPEDDLGCDGPDRIALALVSTETGGPLLYHCAETGDPWIPLFEPWGTVPVSRGGTGATSLTPYAPVCGGTTTTGAVQSCGTGLSTSGYVLTSNGASALPSWQAASGGGVADPLTIGTVITTTSLQPRGGGSYPEDQVQIGPGASASSSVDNYGAVANGRLATASDAGAVCEGDSCNAGLWGTCYGYGAICPADSNGASGFGKLANVSGTGACFGGGCAGTGAGSGAFAQLARAVYDFSLVFGWSARDTGPNQLVIGGPGPILDAWIGKGVTSASPPTDLTMHSTDASGSDTAATNYRIAGGAATGNAAGGAIVLLTSDAGASGSTLQTLTEKARIPTDGGVRIADPGTRPACDSTHRGTIWYDAGNSGVADEFTICCKDAANSYAWVYPGSCHA